MVYVYIEQLKVDFTEQLKTNFRKYKKIYCVFALLIWVQIEAREKNKEEMERESFTENVY